MSFTTLRSLRPANTHTLALLAAFVSGCAVAPSATPAPAPAPAIDAPRPAIAASPAPTVAPPVAAARNGPPLGWHRLDFETDGVMGVGSERALRELLASRQPRRTVVVAVIDGGVDTAHALLRSRLWTNPKEMAGNGKDDDQNGYTDDVHGWNLLGGASGSINEETSELTRLYAACRGLRAGTGIARPDDATCTRLSATYGDKRRELEANRDQLNNVAAAYARATATLREVLGITVLTADRVAALRPTTPSVAQAQRIWQQLAAAGADSAKIAEAIESVGPRATIGLDTMYYGRGIVGDTTPALRRLKHGNADVTGPDASHGTHVAGIIAAMKDASGSGVAGIAPFAQVMGVRAVPNGDERDEDIAAAIRYAVDNGAHIINMSFGKAYSPGKASVDSAVRYADAKGVLLVHSAGNEGEDNDSVAAFPVAAYASGGTVRNWLEIGASSWKSGMELPATFSNYGRATVDLFAPGVDVMSTLPGDKTGEESGTSMAAPVVSGVAALLMAYFPDLSAADVRALITRTARRLPELDVKRPGEESATVKFGTLSKTGGVVDAYAAVKAALGGKVVTP